MQRPLVSRNQTVRSRKSGLILGRCSSGAWLDVSLFFVRSWISGTLHLVCGCVHQYCSENRNFSLLVHCPKGRSGLGESRNRDTMDQVAPNYLYIIAMVHLDIVSRFP